LTPPTQTFDSTVKGIVDVGYAGTGMTPGRFPLTEVLDLPFGTRYAYESTRLLNAFFKKFKPKEFDKVKMLFLQGQSPMIFHSKKPIHSLEDLKGMKIRCPGGFSTQVVKALGAVPLVLSTGETYDALRKGVADGILTGVNTLAMFRFAEVTQYTVMSPRTGLGSSGYIVMNKDKWNSFSPDIQKTIEQLSEEWAEKMGAVVHESDERGMKASAEKKRTLITLSKEEEARWLKKIDPFYDAYIKEKSAMGLPAAEAVTFCRDWVKTNVK
jgi:TRAP-type C4-dicarboxylate transport system substrate-binding protein